MHDGTATGEGEQESWRQIEQELQRSRKARCARCHCPAEAHQHYTARWNCSLCSCLCYLGLPRWLNWLLFEMSGWVWAVAAVTDYAAYWATVFALHYWYGNSPYPHWADWMIIWSLLLYAAIVSAWAGWCWVRRHMRRSLRRSNEPRG